MEKRGKCCGTCLWCYTEEDIKSETYDDEEFNTIKAGDCIMGMQNLHGNYPYCGSYDPIPELESTYVVYDDTYLGPGYFIINEIDGCIQKFIKIYVSNKQGLPFYKIRACELGLKETNGKYDKIKFNLSYYLNKDLFKIIRELKENLNTENIKSIDKLHDKKNTLEIMVENDAALLIVSKENDSNNYIDISLGNNYSSDYYEIISEFYEELSLLATKNDNITKTLKIS